jgi:hypothetical protein
MRIKPYRIMLNNLAEKYKGQAKYRKVFQSKEDAYEMLKRYTGQDFGYDIDSWERWLKENKKL